MIFGTVSLAMFVWLVVNRTTLSLLRRKRAEFHGAGRFTRYRYPAKFHHPPITTGCERAPVSSSSHAAAAQRLPASLRTRTRYGQEPTVQATGPRHHGPRHRGPRHRVPRHGGPRHDGLRHDGPRHQAPRHHGPRPVKARCRRTPQQVDRAVQCALRVVSAESSCQAGSGATTHVDQSVGTASPSYEDAVVMTTQVSVVSRMTETELRLVDLPAVDLTCRFTDKLTISDTNPAEL